MVILSDKPYIPVKARRKLKHNLLGLCGRESIKGEDKILAAFSYAYGVPIDKINKIAYSILRSGTLLYTDGSEIRFTLLTEEDASCKRYRVNLCDLSNGWGPH